MRHKSSLQCEQRMDHLASQTIILHMEVPHPVQSSPIRRLKQSKTIKNFLQRQLLESRDISRFAIQYLLLLTQHQNITRIIGFELHQIASTRCSLNLSNWIAIVSNQVQREQILFCCAHKYSCHQVSGLTRINKLCIFHSMLTRNQVKRR
ncbi:unnamed protein product [Albugo candida]|uniref:Uncharacterized protein n=1 Tax=Albugo candida TaxID=65357 RepID=A0A024GJ73_9STRA|nr:unnamed protein product [Albugo candida]|eukprot:CCI46766.1 unnamed protein product [Albugo candida]